MNVELKKHCESIGEHLIKEAKYCPKGVFWDLGCSPSNLYIRHGQSGILLFLVELYNVTQNEYYLDIIEESTQWIKGHLLINRHEPGFFDGTLGVLYTIFQVYKLNGESKLLDVIMDGISVQQSKVKRYNHVLSHGTAGDILALVYFQKRFNIKFLDHQIEELINYLFKNSNEFSYGIYWEAFISNKNNLSFISGNLGIYYALNKLFSIYEYEQIENVLKGSRHFINNVYQKYLPHLSFLDKCYISIDFQNQTIELDDNYSTLQKILLKKNNKLQTKSNTIINGRTGLGLCYLERFRNSKDIEYYKAANRIGGIIIKDILETKKYSNEFRYKYDDLSFFNGISGIGYFLCRLFNEPTDNISEKRSLERTVRQFQIATRPKYIYNRELLFFLEKPKYKAAHLLSSKIPSLKLESFKAFKNHKAEYEKNIDYIIFHIKDHLKRKFLFYDFAKVISEKEKFLYHSNMDDKLAGKYWINPFSIHLTTEKQDNILILKTSFGVADHFINDTTFQILMLIINNTKLKQQLKNFKHQIKQEGNSVNTEKINSFYLSQLTEFIRSEIIFCEIRGD